MTTLTQTPYLLPAADLGSENPLPAFRAQSPDLAVGFHPSLPEPKRAHMGEACGRRVLPYRLQDGYSRTRKPHEFQALVLENEALTATFLPELGGRLVSLVYKPLARELLARNPVFQPANLAICNAWFSGGIEWNMGQFGHTFGTCSPVFSARVQGGQGEPGLRLYGYERCKGLFWSIDFTLPPGFPWLVANTRLYNPGPEATSTYWWTNIAVTEAEGVRVLAPAREAIYIETAEHSFGLTQLPGLPSLQGTDGTYSLNSPFANEFFFQCEASDMPWEAALDRTGRGLVEVSTPRLAYRKMFCWGTHPGGRHWQEFLAPGAPPYIEIQAGLAPTQLHGLSLPAGADWQWTQAFGYLETDPAQAHSPDWEQAWRSVEGAIHARLTPARLVEIDAACQPLADQPPLELLTMGSGWGALELARHEAAGERAPLSPALTFPPSSLGTEQKRWLPLLTGGVLPEQPPEELPGEWLISADWRNRLERSLAQPAGRHWFAYLHLGVMDMEGFDLSGAEAAWLASLAIHPSVWVLRNLAVLAQRRGQGERALEFYRQAWELAIKSGLSLPSLAAEVMGALLEASQPRQALDFERRLEPFLRDQDRVQLLRGQAALQVGELDVVEEVLQRDYAVIQEGETGLTDLWFGMWRLRLGEALTQAELEQRRPPPVRIDFRSSM